MNNFTLSTNDKNLIPQDSNHTHHWCPLKQNWTLLTPAIHSMLIPANMISTSIQSVLHSQWDNAAHALLSPQLPSASSSSSTCCSLASGWSVCCTPSGGPMTMTPQHVGARGCTSCVALKCGTTCEITSPSRWDLKKSLSQGLHVNHCFCCVCRPAFTQPVSSVHCEGFTSAGQRTRTSRPLTLPVYLIFDLHLHVSSGPLSLALAAHVGGSSSVQSCGLLHTHT